MQELHHHKLESAISSYDEERPQTRAIRTSAVETAFGLPAAQQLAQKALPGMRVQASTIHAEYMRLCEQRDKVEARKQHATRKLTKVGNKLQGMTAVRALGKSFGVQEVKVGPRSAQMALEDLRKRGRPNKPPDPKESSRPTAVEWTPASQD